MVTNYEVGDKVRVNIASEDYPTATGVVRELLDDTDHPMVEIEDAPDNLYALTTTGLYPFPSDGQNIEKIEEEFPMEDRPFEVGDQVRVVSKDEPPSPDARDLEVGDKGEITEVEYEEDDPVGPWVRLDGLPMGAVHVSDVELIEEAEQMDTSNDLDLSGGIAFQVNNERLLDALLGELEDADVSIDRNATRHRRDYPFKEGMYYGTEVYDFSHVSFCLLSDDRKYPEEEGCTFLDFPEQWDLIVDFLKNPKKHINEPIELMGKPVEFTDEGIKVGCQSVSAEFLDKLRNHFDWAVRNDYSPLDELRTAVKEIVPELEDRGVIE